MLYPELEAMLANHELEGLEFQGIGGGWDIACSCAWISPISHSTYKAAVSAHARHVSIVLGKAGYSLMHESGAAALRAVADSWGSGGRRTVRLEELEDIATSMENREWNSLLVWGLQDITLKNRRKEQNGA